MFTQPRSMKNQRGNALLLVLIGVALFAALSYVVAKNSGNSAGTIDKENNSLLASQILEYAKQLQQGVNIIKQNGYSENQISFAHPDLTGYGTYDTSPETEVFNPRGGGASYKTFPKATNDDWIFSGSNAAYRVPIPNELWASCTAACSDIVALLANISKELCMELNERVGVANPSNNPPQMNTTYSTTKFTGSFVKDRVLYADFDYTNGKRAACMEGKNSPTPVGSYHFFYVLLER
ncbi:MAG: hypothetical protein CMH30_07940 [Micavibrio sp.]|nr:hypothetical protein [Micavibrio sp.]